MSATRRELEALREQISTQIAELEALGEESNEATIRALHRDLIRVDDQISRQPPQLSSS